MNFRLILILILNLMIIPIILNSQTTSIDSTKSALEYVKYRDNILKFHSNGNSTNGFAIEYMYPETIIDSLKINGLHLDLNPADAVVSIPGSILLTFTASMIFMYENPFIMTTVDSVNLNDTTYCNNEVNGMSISIWNFDFMSAKNNFEKNVNGIDLNLSYSSNCIVNGISLSTFASPYVKLNGLVVSGLFTYGEQMNGIAISTFQNYSIKANGLQIGLFNKSHDFKGIQIGFWNINNARTLPFLNWNF